MEEQLYARFNMQNDYMNKHHMVYIYEYFLDLADDERRFPGGFVLYI